MTLKSIFKLSSPSETIVNRKEEENGKTGDTMVSSAPLLPETLSKNSELKCKVCHEIASINLIRCSKLLKCNPWCLCFINSISNLRLHHLKPKVYVYHLHQEKFRKYNTS